MANYGRIQVAAEVASTSDYRSKIINLPESIFANATPTKQMLLSPVLSTAALTIDLGVFTSILAMAIVNRSATAAEVVDATWFHQKWTAAGNIDIAQVATGDTVTDNGASFASFVTLGAVAGDFVRITDAAAAGNNAAWAIQTVAAEVLTLVAQSTLTIAAADAVTLSCERRNTQGIAASNGLLIVTDNVVPAGDLVLTSESGTPSVDVFIFGT
jgi:hypothetical protein